MAIWLQLRGEAVSSKRSTKAHKERSSHVFKDPDVEWKKQLEQLQMGLKIMESEAAQIPEKHGMTKECLEAMLANPSNFTPSDWQIIEEARKKSKQLQEELAAILPSLDRCGSAPAKERRKAPKKHWIPLQ